eukprot:7102608-Karenia_brevis.AAC.1
MLCLANMQTNTNKHNGPHVHAASIPEGNQATRPTPMAIKPGVATRPKWHDEPRGNVGSSW